MGSSVGPWSGPSCGGSAKGAQALDITDASGIKARKPYTITKQRERWTDEEHSKFLEGLRLFGRAWRKIEEFIGSKTSIQIRSHAQKFFSKVERRGKEPSGELNEVADMDVTAIPPPRPKRKPARPYPKNEHSDSGNGGGGGGGPGEASTMFASAAGGNGGSMGGGGGGGGAGFSNMPQVGGAYMEGSNGVSHHHHYYHHRQQQQQQAPPAYYPCYSDSDVSEATVAAVAAAASAAAAAAAASVIAAAGQHVQAHLQRHPPQGFPFFGVPPSLLAQASLRNPALEAYVHANGLANASEYQWQAGVDPRQRAAQLRSALAEATATNEGGGGSGMSSGRDSDGDSACSRETDDMDSEGAEDGSGAGPNGGGGAPAAAELRAMEMKAAVASWHAGGNGGGVQAHMQEAVQLPLQSRAASGAALHCGAAPQCRLSPGLVDSGGGSKPSADCGTATPTLQGSGESNASRAKRHASNEVATSVRLDHKKVRQQSPDEDSGQCADTLPKGPAGEGQSGGGSVDGATPRRNDSSGSEEDTRAAHGAALHDVQQPRRPAHVQAQVSDPSTPGCGNGSTGSGAQANTSSGNGNGSSGAREGNGSNGSGSDGNGSDGAGNGSDGNGQGSGAATLAARGSGTGREDHIIRAGTASGPPRPADHVHAPASTPGGTHPKRRLRQSSHAALLALDDPGAAGGSRLAAPAVPPVEPSTHTVRPASPWPGHGSALVAAGSLQSATAPRAASVHATATAPPPHASHVAVGASEPSAWAPPTHFTDAHGAPGMVDNMGRLSSGIETSTLQRMLSSVQGQGQGQAAFAPFLAPPPATAFTSQGGLFAVPPPHPRSSQYRLAHTSLPLPGAASTQVLPPPTQLRFGSDGRGLAAPWPGILLPPQQQQQQQPLAYGLASGLGGLAAAPALNTSWLFHPPAQQQQQPYLSAYPVRQLTSSESELVATMDQDRQLQRTRQAPSAPLGFAPPGLPYGASQQVVGSAAARRMSEH